MSTLVLEVPDAVREAVAGEAARRGLTEAAWLEEAVREKLAAEAELAQLRARAARADRAAFDAVLSKVPVAPPELGDAR